MHPAFELGKQQKKKHRAQSKILPQGTHVPDHAASHNTESCSAHPGQMRNGVNGKGCGLGLRTSGKAVRVQGKGFICQLKGKSAGFEL